MFICFFRFSSFYPNQTALNAKIKEAYLPLPISYLRLYYIFMKQVEELHSEFDSLQTKHGDIKLNSIYGAGNINNPDFMFIFMNPTGRNISSNPQWKGLRAPWIGTKQVWDIFSNLNLLSLDVFNRIKSKNPNEWDYDFANQIYEYIQNHKIYITNLAKCTQIDARPLSNNVFKDYLELMYKEIEIVNPKRIVTFGNQVSSILLNKAISVSKYTDSTFELLQLSEEYKVFPTYYPVGQGRRNMPLAINRIKKLV